MKWQVFVLLTSVLVLLTLKSNVLSACIYNDSACQQKDPQYKLFVKPSHLEQLQKYAQSITAKVMSADVLGSGILIEKQGDVYTVLTNAHVIRAGSAPYRVQTSDGKIYEAKLLPSNRFGSKDLATLQFRAAGNIYNIGLIGTSPMVTDEVFAAGFPVYSEKKAINEDFIFNSGQVSLVLDKALEGGYQIAYTNEIEKGMSGGPLLNIQGCVIGVNGRHARPLWDAPSLFDDGSQVNDSLDKIINRFSWAVPIETFLQLQQQKSIEKTSC